MTWARNDPGDRPVVLVGAGFPLAVTDPKPPTTANILQETADRHSAEFPAISALMKGLLCHTTTCSPNRQLNFVWSNMEDFAKSLENRPGNINWKYCFADWLLESPMNDDATHVIVKPHGSVNVWFKTSWGPVALHSLSFANPRYLMETCRHDKVGCTTYNQLSVKCEWRPWLVGYVKDPQKGELNSPVGFADTAHDLCKGNLAYASLRLLHATSLYVLGYSMPQEDEWIWARLRALPRKDLPVYVATSKESGKVLKRFAGAGFRNRRKLTTDGRI